MIRKYITKEALAQCINNCPSNNISLMQMRYWLMMYGINITIEDETVEANIKIEGGDVSD